MLTGADHVKKYLKNISNYQMNIPTYFSIKLILMFKAQYENLDTADSINKIKDEELKDFVIASQILTEDIVDEEYFKSICNENAIIVDINKGYTRRPLAFVFLCTRFGSHFLKFQIALIEKKFIVDLITTEINIL